MQYQVRTGPIQNDAAAITVDMVQGCLPAQQSRARVSRSALVVPPDVTLFANESVIGCHPDTPRLPRLTRGPSFFPWSGTTATHSPEMFAGSHPDTPNRVTRRFASVFSTPDVEPFSIESVFATRPERPRLQLGPRIGQPLSQPTHTSAPITLDMLQGVTSPTKRYIAPMHDGWQWLTPEVPVFSIEMVIGSHPDRPRVLLGQPAGQPIGETADIIPPPPPPPPVDTGATPGWPGSDDTPGYTRGTNPSWITRNYVRQPSQRPTRRVRPVPEPEPPVARQPLPRVVYVPSAPPLRAHARTVGGRGGVGQARASLGLVAQPSSVRQAPMVARVVVAKKPRAMSQQDWFLLNFLSNDNE